VPEVAERFAWPHGPKRVVTADSHLGLVGHFQRAGALTREYGAIILLEDDLVVARPYYRYASQALAYYGADDRIAGVSLYALWFNGYNHLPFVPQSDAADVFFLQIPYYVGQAFTEGQWARYAAWRAASDPTPTARDPIHPTLLTFAPDEWFPERVKFLATTDRYFVFPRESLATGYGDAGTHFDRPSRWVQAPLQQFKLEHRFTPFEASAAVYDAFFEIHPERLRRLAPSLPPDPFDVDLYGTKPEAALRRECVATSRRSRAPLAGWGRVLWPMEANLLHAIAGDDIVLSRRADVRRGRWEELRLQWALYDYFSRGRRLPRRLQWAYALFDRWQRIARRGWGPRGIGALTHRTIGKHLSPARSPSPPREDPPAR
jgi:hypothetical protein